MRKLVFLAIPLLLFGFSSPRNTSKDVFKKHFTTTGFYCLKDCTNPLTYQVRVPSPPGVTYFHVDGVLTTTGGRIFYVPKTATFFSFSTLSGGNYAIYDGGSVSDLADTCAGTATVPVPSCP